MFRVLLFRFIGSSMPVKVVKHGYLLLDCLPIGVLVDPPAMFRVLLLRFISSRMPIRLVNNGYLHLDFLLVSVLVDLPVSYKSVCFAS